MNKRMSRRSFLKLAGASASGAILAACQPKTVIVEKEVEKVVKETVEVEKIVEKEKEVTWVVEKAVQPEGLPLLRFAMYNFDPWLAALPKMFNDFEEEVGTAQVKLESAPWGQFWSRFESQAAAGIAPDLQIGDPFLVARYADKGLYLEVDPYIDADGVDLSEWLLASTQACRFEKGSGLMEVGPMYGMPATLVGTILYYNKDLFD